MEVFKRKDFARWQVAQRLSLQSGVFMEVCCEQQTC